MSKAKLCKAIQIIRASTGDCYLDIEIVRDVGQASPGSYNRYSSHVFR